MILIAVFTAFIANFDPALGLFFIVLLGGKYYLKQKYTFLSIFCLASILSYFLMRENLSDFTIVESLIGVALAYFVFMEVFLTKNKLSLSLVSFFGIESVFCLIRHFTYGEKFIQTLSELIEASRIQIERDIVDPAQLKMVSQFFEIFKSMIIKYNFAFMLGSLLIAAYFGFLFFAKRNKISIHHQKLQLPFFLVYIVIGGLALSLYPQTRTMGMNILLALSPLFFFQGISVTDFFWRKHFTKHKGIIVVSIITLAFIPPLFSFNIFILIL